MPTDKEIYWDGQLLAPLGARTERERRTARKRTCRTCEGTLFVEDPERVRGLISPLGHDSDCRSLAIALNGFGGGGPADPAPHFGSSEPIFGSTDPIFGQP